MKFNKIGLIAVSLSSVFFAPSCKQAARLTYDQAKAWVTKNCDKGEATPTSGNHFFDFSKTFGDKARNTVKRQIETTWKITLDENLIGKKQFSDEELEPKGCLSLDVLRIVSNDGMNAMFNVLNNKITITVMFDFSSMAGVSGKMAHTTQFTKKGLFLFEERNYYYLKGETLGDRAAVIGRDRITYNY